MPRFALLIPHAVCASQHTGIELDRDELTIEPADSRRRRVPVRAASYRLRDATSQRRFVEHLTLYSRHGSEQFITPPEAGAIAPRGARLPEAPTPAWVIGGDDFAALRLWLAARQQLHRLTVLEIAILCERATSNFAVELGELAADRAVQTTWERRGPLRGGVGVREALAPLMAAASRSERAHEAVVAALAKAYK